MKIPRSLLNFALFLAAFTWSVHGDNAPPVITGLAAKTINEDATTTVSFSVSDVDNLAASITVTASATDPNLIVSSVIPGGSGASRTLAITPVANKNGTATITVTATDPGTASVTSSFVLTVKAVNDAPTFTLTVSTVTVGANAGMQSIPNFVTAISPGPNETGTVTFTVTPSISSLFSTAPAISSAGTLTFKPMTGVTGNTTVTVTAKDNGLGTAPNVNTSSAQTFKIVVASGSAAATLQDLSGGKTGQRVALAGYLSVRATIEPLVRLPDGTVHLKVTGASGSKYVIQASSDLMSWKRVGLLDGSEDVAEFIDDSAAYSDARFYRIIEQQSPDR